MNLQFKIHFKILRVKLKLTEKIKQLTTEIKIINKTIFVKNKINLKLLKLIKKQ